MNNPASNIRHFWLTLHTKTTAREDAEFENTEYTTQVMIYQSPFVPENAFVLMDGASYEILNCFDLVQNAFSDFLKGERPDPDPVNMFVPIQLAADEEI